MSNERDGDGLQKGRGEEKEDEREGGRGNKTWRLRRKRARNERPWMGNTKQGGVGGSFLAGDRKRGDDRAEQSRN